MVIFINGAFGVGKTTTATLLEQRLENAMIFDPEYVGIMLRTMIRSEWKYEHEKTGDFQDFDLWKVLTVKLINEFMNQYKCDLIVPMTIRKIEYFDYIYNGVQEYENEVYHFCLSASKENIHKRLEKRGDELNSWAFHQTDKCIEGFKYIEEKIEIENDNIEVEDVVNQILEKINSEHERLYKSKTAT